MPVRRWDEPEPEREPSLAEKASLWLLIGLALFYLVGHVVRALLAGWRP